MHSLIHLVLHHQSQGKCHSSRMQMQLREEKKTTKWLEFRNENSERDRNSLLSNASTWNDSMARWFVNINPKETGFFFIQSPKTQNNGFVRQWQHQNVIDKWEVHICFSDYFFALDFSVVFVSVSNKMYEMFAYIMCQFINGREESEINGTHATYSRAHDDIVRHANIWWHLAIVRWLVGPPGTSNQTQMGNNISMTFICESWPANVSAEFCHRNKIKNGEKNERL